MIPSRASRSASDSTTSGESSASRRVAAKATRLTGMMHNLASVDPIRSSATRQGIGRKRRGQKIVRDLKVFSSEGKRGAQTPGGHRGKGRYWVRAKRGGKEPHAIGTAQ